MKQPEDPEDIYCGEVLAVNSTKDPSQCHDLDDLVNLNSDEEDDKYYQDLLTGSIREEDPGGNVNLINLTIDEENEEDILNINIGEDEEDIFNVNIEEDEEDILILNIEEQDLGDDILNEINLTVGDEENNKESNDLNVKEEYPEGGGDVNVINLTDSDTGDDEVVKIIGAAAAFGKSEENFIVTVDLTTEDVEGGDTKVVSQTSIQNSEVKKSVEKRLSSAETVTIVIEDDPIEEASSKRNCYLNDPLDNFQPSVGCESTPKAKSFAKSKNLLQLSRQSFQAQDLGEGIKSNTDAEESDDELVTSINNYIKSTGTKECQYGQARYKHVEDMEISNLTASFSEAMAISFNNYPDSGEKTPVNVNENSSKTTSTLTSSKLSNQAIDMKSLCTPGDYIEPRVILQQILDYFINKYKKTDADLEDKSDMDISRIFEIDEQEEQKDVVLILPSDQKIEQPPCEPEPVVETKKINKTECLLKKLFDDEDMVILDSTGIDDSFVFRDLEKKEDPLDLTKVNKVPPIESCSKSDQVLKLSKASTTIKKTTSVKSQQEELKSKINNEIVSKPVIKEIKTQPKKPPPPLSIKPSQPKKITLNQNLLNDLMKTSEIKKFAPTGKKKRGLHFINLHEDSLEYRHIKGLFNKTIFKLRSPLIIQKIEKVINPYLFFQYLLKRESDSLKFGAHLTEHLLFHGTPASKVNSICSDNFNWRLTGLSRGHKYGQGVNFAWDASYASHYVKDQGNCKVIVALLGNDNASEGDSKTKLPLPYCDATANNTGEVLVKYEDNEFYPAYVVHCSRSWAVKPKNYNNQYYVDWSYHLARQPWLPSANFDYNYSRYRGNSHNMDFISDIYY